MSTPIQFGQWRREFLDLQRDALKARESAVYHNARFESLQSRLNEMVGLLVTGRVNGVQDEPSAPSDIPATLAFPLK